MIWEYLNMKMHQICIVTALVLSVTFPEGKTSGIYLTPAESVNLYLEAYWKHLDAWKQAAHSHIRKENDFEDIFKHHIPHLRQLASENGLRSPDYENAAVVSWYQPLPSIQAIGKYVTYPASNILSNDITASSTERYKDTKSDVSYSAPGVYWVNREYESIKHTPDSVARATNSYGIMTEKGSYSESHIWQPSQPDFMKKELFVYKKPEQHYIKETFPVVYHGSKSRGASYMSPQMSEEKMDSMIEHGCMSMMEKKRGIMGDHVTWDLLEGVCHQCVHWSRACRSGSAKPTQEVMTWWHGLLDRRLHQRRHKRQAQRLPQRREYRSLSDEERQRFHDAVVRLKNTYIGEISQYDVFVMFHQPSMSPSAHFGPAFYGWHREMLTRFENALQEIDPGVSLPYWDSRMDGNLGDDLARQTVTWSNAFLGNLDGEVNTGPFAGFRLLYGVGGRETLHRGRIGGRLMTDDDVANAVNARSFRDITFFVDPSFETAHGAVHNWVGGVFGDLVQSPSDPVLYLHHAFIDCVWEAHRQNTQNFTEYPSDGEALGVGAISPNGHRPESPQDSIHYPGNPLRPFDDLLNIDGHSTQYTSTEYTCATPPTCSGRQSCGSPYLFCDEDTGVCLPRLALGGDCSSFGGFNPCYDAGCCNGRCSRDC